MSIYGEIAEAMTIFEKYKDLHEPSIDVGHDILYAGPHPRIATAEDVSRLNELGWHEDYSDECFRKNI